MLVVETVARIRREHFVKGKTIKEIARDLGVSRNTVRRVLRSGETDMALPAGQEILDPLPLIIAQSIAVHVPASLMAAAYVPLSFAPGEAYQFDWSHEVVLLNGVTVGQRGGREEVRHGVPIQNHPVNLQSTP
jgi:hypothetical protein